MYLSSNVEHSFKFSLHPPLWIKIDTIWLLQSSRLLLLLEYEHRTLYIKPLIEDYRAKNLAFALMKAEGVLSYESGR